MAHLWTRQEVSEWAPLPLESDVFDLSASPPRETRLSSAGGEGQVLLARVEEARGWVLLTGPGHRVRVNGSRLSSGIRVLSDRDEIRIDGVGTFFFSTEKLAAVEPLPEQVRPIFCPRCKQEIRGQTPAVQCPQCRVWHHQSPELPCWTYSGTCALDDQPTNLDADYRWTPREL
jgi:hypothetical protein